MKSRRKDGDRTKKIKTERSDDDEDQFDKIERERLADLKERDEFAKRLKENDKGKTKNVSSKSGK